MSTGIDDERSYSQEFKQLSLIREWARPTHSKVDLLDSKRGWRSEYCIRGYFVDYYNILTKTILEFDGPHHLKSERKTFDDFRDTYLKSLGYTIIRVTDAEKLHFFLRIKGAEVHGAEMATSVSFFSQPRPPHSEQSISQEPLLS